MLIWVMYDIVENKIRSKLAKKCKEEGLYRVQKSVFFGEINKTQLKELKVFTKDLIALDKDSVYIFPMSKDELKVAGLIGQAFDKEMVSNELISKFF